MKIEIKEDLCIWSVFLDDRLMGTTLNKIEAFKMAVGFMFEHLEE